MKRAASGTERREVTTPRRVTRSQCCFRTVAMLMRSQIKKGRPKWSHNMVHFAVAHVERKERFPGSCISLIHDKGGS